MALALLASVCLLVLANVFFLKYYMLRFQLDFLKNINFDEILDVIADETKKINSNGYENAMDLRGTPTHVCPCGSEIWNLKVTFEDFQINGYLLDMECVNCGSLATAPTPIDKETK